MNGLLPTRCSIDFKPQYPGDKARSYELGYSLFAPQIATKELKLLLNNDSSLFDTRGCHRPMLAVKDHPSLAALIPEGKTLRYCMCSQLGSKETAEGRKKYSKEAAPWVKSYHKDAAPTSTMLSPIDKPCPHYMVATVTVAGPSSEPAPPPYVGRCKRGAICRFSSTTHRASSQQTTSHAASKMCARARGATTRRHTGRCRYQVDTRAPLSNTIETTSPTVAAERRGKKNKAQANTGTTQ